MATQNQMLKQRYNLHSSDEIKSAAERTRSRTGEKVPQDPEAQIQNYLDRFSEIIQRLDVKDREKGINALKKLAHDKFVTKYEDISESYWELQERIIRERGQEADYRFLTEEQKEQGKKQLAEGLINDQIQSLDFWIDYLASNDSDYMPDYIKYWVFRSLIGLQEYDKANKQFPKRSKGTVKMFPELNPEALAYVIDAVLKKHRDVPLSFDELEKKLTEEQKEEFKKSLSSENFGKLYAWAFEQLKPVSENLLQKVEGKWIKYEQNSDHRPLVASLRGKSTGWCTAGESTAIAQLQGGDFYVYYSNDENGNPTVPRIAIRMEWGKIAEIRGTAIGQNLESNMDKVLKEKLDEFPDKAEYLVKEADMRKLTDIEKKFKQNEHLTEEEIRFLYELDREIMGFGYQKDPRIESLRRGRDLRKDLASLFNLKPKEVSTNPKEALSGSVKLYYGDLDLSGLTSAEGLIFPESIKGNLDLRNLTSAEGIIFPNSIEGSIDLSNLKSAKKVTFPSSYKGDIDLRNLTSAEGTVFPNSIEGSIDLHQLTSVKNVTFPSAYKGDLDLRNLTSAEGVIFPNSIEGTIDLYYLRSAKNVTFPPSVRSLILSNLRSFEGLNLPNVIEKNLNLSGLTSANGLKFPQSIGGNLNLSGLTSVEGLNLPNVIEKTSILVA